MSKHSFLIRYYSTNSTTASRWGLGYATIDDDEETSR